MRPVPCPFCRTKTSALEEGIWPFCSERCKQADLGKWAMGAYVVPGGTIRKDEEFLLDDDDTADSGDESES